MANILLLEPDRLLAGNLSAYLKRAGHHVMAHGDPQAAVTAADGQKPDLVVTELQMAGRSGAEFLYEFRSYSDWQNIPVIIFTSLHPARVQTYAQVLDQLNIQACLYKSQAGLAGLSDQIRRTLRPTAV